MRGISIRAFFVSNILNPILIFTAAFILLITMAAVLQTSGENSTSFTAIAHSEVYLRVLAMITVLAVFFVGYVAASLSERSLMLNAGLSTAVLIVWNVVLLFKTTSTPTNWLLVAISWASPLWAIFGGYIRKQQTAKGAQPIHWGRVSRFALAIIAAMLVGLILFAVLARITPYVAISSAVVGSLVAGYLIAPSEMRVHAAWIIFGVVATAAIAIFMTHAFNHSLKGFDYFLLLSVAGGAMIGRGVLRPLKAASPINTMLKATTPSKDSYTASPKLDPDVERLWMRPEKLDKSPGNDDQNAS